MPHDSIVRLPLIQGYLQMQNELSAVERFSRHHDTAVEPERFYKDLIPLSKPASGEQYAFEVDLDRCTSCKACVTACHSMNGLDENETWRFVGLVHGGTAEAPVQQSVTTACHHCVDPACLKGCPVEAYEKDPVTGIVKHLDDQCIGCQYCTLMCPYEVPQYSVKKGIVRKCDMCSDRLAVGEAPACVQACPNEAIAIGIVSKQAVLEGARANAFVPGAPSSGITAPTTTYRSERSLSHNTLPADYHLLRPAHQHRPLVVMLVLTQLSVGAFGLDRALQAVLPAGALAAYRPLHALIALALGLVALAASVFHLGRPLYAFRAFLGLRTSWMSREIVAFAAFAKIGLLYAALLWRHELSALFGVDLPAEALTAPLERLAGAGVALFGIAGVFCSVMIYYVTQRRFWSFGQTALKFFGTSLTLGAAILLLTAAIAGMRGGGSPALIQAATAAAWLAGVTVLAKLAVELSILRHRADAQNADLRRSALLLVTDFNVALKARVAFALAGGVVLPALYVGSLAGGFGLGPVLLASLGLLCLTLGELLERTFFFAAVSAPRMPGTIS